MSARPLLLLLVLLLVACGSPATPAGSDATQTISGELVVFAAASLTDAFTALGQEFQTLNEGTTVTFSFANSQQLATQINEGAQADVFASANPRQLTTVIEGGRITSGVERVFARNRLVVITPADNPAGIRTLVDLAQPQVKLIIADQVTPVGQYTQDFLEKASALPEFSETYSSTVNANVVSLEDTVRAVLTKVSLGEADAGVVYTSDVALDRSQVTVIDIPDALNTLAEYPIAALNDTSNPALAAAFVDFVLAPRGQEILETYGFQRVN